MPQPGHPNCPGGPCAACAAADQIALRDLDRALRGCYGARMARSGWSRFESDHPAKRQAERHFLRFTPVWGGVAALVMWGGFAERWGDVPLLLLGLGLGLGAVWVPLWRPGPGEQGVPWSRRAGVKLALSVIAFAFGLNYFQTPFFWEVLHMHYGFGTDWNIDSNPVFLYLLTVAYFATYCALVNGAYRAARRSLGGPWRWLAAVLAPFAVAFLESALNANPFMGSLFCFDDMGWMLSFGTFTYGLALALCLWVWIGIDERPGHAVPLPRVLGWVCLAVALDTLALQGLQHGVAPHFTRVQPGARGLRDYDTSCLERPAP